MNYLIKEGPYLVSSGFAPDGQEDKYVALAKGQQLVLKDHFDNLPDSKPPFTGARWNLLKRVWEDCRTAAERTQHQFTEFEATRRAAYPGLEVLADALYWQSKGDPSKLIAYWEACDTVKQNIPKPSMT